jgi:hypothetical protein
MDHPISNIYREQPICNCLPEWAHNTFIPDGIIDTEITGDFQEISIQYHPPINPL